MKKREPDWDLAAGSIRARRGAAGLVLLKARQHKRGAFRYVTVILFPGQVRALARWLNPVEVTGPAERALTITICPPRPDFLTRLPKIRRKSKTP